MTESTTTPQLGSTPQTPADQASSGQASTHMADTYDSNAGLITDQLVDTPGLLTPVADDFAAASDDGYGQWVGADEDTEDTSEDASEPTDVAADDDDADAAALSPDQQTDLDELHSVMNDRSGSGLLGSSGRSAYVHRDDDEDPAADTAAAAVTAMTQAPTTARAPWWRFGCFDWSRRSHRILAVAAATVIVLAVIVLIPTGSEPDSTQTSPTEPAFTVPTVTQSPAPANPGQHPSDGTDKPIGIKRADSRCTAGSTDPMQAFDNNPDTAWMCVPAYGVPGTVLRVEFDNWYVVTAMTIVPGWNRVNPDGSDEWIQHKTAAVVEYQFNDPDETRLVQETLNLRDEVLTPVNPPVLASAMTITITELGTPTGQVANTTTVPGQGATLATDTPASGDLKDFAISSINIIGHRAR